MSPRDCRDGEFEPGRLWSLWEIMRAFKVEHLIALVRDLYMVSTLSPDDKSSVRENVRAILLDKSQALLGEVEGLDLPVSAQQIRTLIQLLISGPHRGEVSTTQRHTNMIATTIETELSLRTFFAVKPEQANLYQDANFGGDVQSRFPSAAYDIDEAAKCMALERYTAAAFHLMRSLEIGIRGAARCLQIPDPTKPAERNWGTIQRVIKEEIEQRNKGLTRGWKDDGERKFFEEAYTSLDAVRNTWRNATMHVENKYTQEEADNIYRAVRFFTRKLSSRFDELGKPFA